MLRSGFGSQVKSVNPSNPSWGFGTSNRDASLKQYLSAEHAKVMTGNVSQGPVYKNYSGIGPQPESKLASSATFSFGSSTRLPKQGKSWVPGPGAYQDKSGIGQQTESKRSTSPRAVFGSSTRDIQEKVYLDDDLMKTYYGKESPGPNAYNVPAGIGAQADSKRESAPAWRQGTSERFKYDFITRAKELPGAGTYNASAALGKQTLSLKKTLPQYSFGSSTRDAALKTFISKEHEKQSFGELSPGPTTAQPSTSMGKQSLSVRSSSPGWGFGTARRNKEYATAVPGPGTYYA